jgi:hypothetical protein
MNMNASQARVVDPILTNHARGYGQSGFIGDLLMPIVTMPTRAAKRIEFGREAFKRYKIIRAPGGAIARIQVGHEGKPVSLIQRALGATTPIEHMEEAEKVPGIDLLMENTNTVLAAIQLDREISQAEAARDASKYANTNKAALAGGDKWSHADSRPDEQVEEGKEVVRKRTGRRPNTLALAAPVRSKLKIHPRVIGRFATKAEASPVISDAMLAQFFDVEQVLVGDAIYDNDADATVDVWGTEAILAFVPNKGQAGMRVPAFGYTYRLGGHPYVEPAYYERGTKSWINDVTDEWSAELVGPDAGFLFQGAV